MGRNYALLITFDIRYCHGGKMFAQEPAESNENPKTDKTTNSVDNAWRPRLTVSFDLPVDRSIASNLSPTTLSFDRPLVQSRSTAHAVFEFGHTRFVDLSEESLPSEFSDEVRTLTALADQLFSVDGIARQLTFDDYSVTYGSDASFDDDWIDVAVMTVIAEYFGLEIKDVDLAIPHDHGNHTIPLMDHVAILQAFSRDDDYSQFVNGLYSVLLNQLGENFTVVRLLPIDLSGIFDDFEGIFEVPASDLFDWVHRFGASEEGQTGAEDPDSSNTDERQ